eukprot:COSAG02_NODE_9786_length_2110_cov_3.602188_1_plen_175_part_00
MGQQRLLPCLGPRGLLLSGRGGAGRRPAGRRRSRGRRSGLFSMDRPTLGLLCALLLGPEGRRGRPAPVSCCFCVDVFCTAELSALVAHGIPGGHSILPARKTPRSTCAALEVVDRSPRHVPPPPPPRQLSSAAASIFPLRYITQAAFYSSAPDAVFSKPFLCAPRALHSRGQFG